MNQLQVLVKKFNEKHEVKIKRNSRALDLASEVGEVCKLSFSEDMGKPVAPDKWQEELGDVLYSLLSLMNDLDIDSEVVLRGVLEKYNDRITNRKSMDSNL